MKDDAKSNSEDSDGTGGTEEFTSPELTPCAIFWLVCHLKSKGFGWNDILHHFETRFYTIRFIESYMRLVGVKKDKTIVDDDLLKENYLDRLDDYAREINENHLHLIEEFQNIPEYENQLLEIGNKTLNSSKGVSTQHSNQNFELRLSDSAIHEMNSYIENLQRNAIPEPNSDSDPSP